MTTIYNKYRSWFTVNNQLRKIAKVCLSTYTPAHELKDHIVVFSLAKAYKSHDATIELCKKGFGEDAGIILRTLFELDVLVKFVLIDKSDKTAKLFAEYESLEREKMYNSNNIPEIRDLMKLRKNYQEIIDQMKIDATNAKENPLRLDKNGKLKAATWSGKTYEEMAKIVNLNDSYNIAYRLFSQLTHSSPRIVSFYLKDSRDGIIEPKEYPSEDWISECLVKAFDFLFDIVYEYNIRFACKQEIIIGRILKRYTLLLKQ